MIILFSVFRNAEPELVMKRIRINESCSGIGSVHDTVIPCDIISHINYSLT